MRTLPFQLGRHTLFDHVGRGGMADIYLARSKTALGAARLVVIKEVIPQLVDNEHFVEMLIAEAKLAAQLSHANIARVEDLGREDGILFIAMEYVEGLDLRELLRRCTRRKLALPIGYSLSVMCEVLKALDYAHRFVPEGAPTSRQGIVHRDVSPSNVLLSFDGEVKLCDFGIASAMAADDTLSATIEGKAGYMSPEHARGEPMDTRADLFAAGIMTWELLSGRRMYKRQREGGPPLIEVARRAMVPAPPRCGLPQEAKLHAVLRRALAVDRRDRYQNAAEMLADLEGYCVTSQLLSSSMRFGGWLSEHFAAQQRQRVRARQRVLQALELGPPVVMETIARPPSSHPPSADRTPSSKGLPSKGSPRTASTSTASTSTAPPSPAPPSPAPARERVRAVKPTSAGELLALAFGSAAAVFALLWILSRLGLM